MIINIFYLESTLKKFVFSIFGDKLLFKIISRIFINKDDKIFNNRKSKIEDFLYPIMLDIIKNKKTSKYKSDEIDNLSFKSTITIIQITNINETYGLEIPKGFIKDLKYINRFRNILCHPYKNLEVELEKILKLENISKENKNFKNLNTIIERIYEIQEFFRKSTEKIILEKQETN